MARFLSGNCVSALNGFCFGTRDGKFLESEALMRRGFVQARCR